MYIPTKYKNADLEAVKDFIENNAFALMVSNVENRPWASHIPLELQRTAKDETVLIGHLSNANKQCNSLRNGDEVLCIFNGPHAYVSSSWYKEEEVPTWDYIAVHMYGSIEIQTQEELLSSLHHLVDKYEQHSENPVSLHHMSPGTMRQIKGITGFRIKVSEIEAAYKLSQGREQDHPEITYQLAKRGGQAAQVAREIHQNSLNKL